MFEVQVSIIQHIPLAVVNSFPALISLHGFPNVQNKRNTNVNDEVNSGLTRVFASRLLKEEEVIEMQVKGINRTWLYYLCSTVNWLNLS